jgi:hypothetical protein
VRKDAEVKVYVARIAALVPRDMEMERVLIEVSRIRELYCAVDRETAERHNRDHPNFIRASAAESARWRAASKAFLRAMKTVRRRADRRLLRGDYVGKAFAACQDFRMKAEALSWRVKEAREREWYRVLNSREYRESYRETEERWARGLEERKRAKRVAMARAPGKPVWAYTLYTLSARHRCFRIRLPSVEDGALLPSRGLPFEILSRTGLTPKQVQSALAEERSRYRHTTVEWAPDTKIVLEEWHESGTVERAWQELTGERVDPDPRPPNEQRESQRFHGPSSNYFSPGSFGPHC